MTIESVRLSRGACLGECPVYDVVFHRNGAAEFLGFAHAARIGRFVGSASRWRFARLARAVERAGFFGWDEIYESPVTDFPEYRIEVVRDAVSTMVIQYATEEPDGFRQLADRIDRLANDVVWAQARHGPRGPTIEG